MSMNNKEIKKLMTRVAKGEISEKDADLIISGKKKYPGASGSKFEGNTRKRLIKSKGGKIK